MNPSIKACAVIAVLILATLVADTASAQETPVTAIELPRTRETAIDLAIAGIYLILGTSSLILYFYRRSELLLILSGVALSVFGIISMAARSVVTTYQVIVNGTLQYQYEPNPNAGIHIVGVLLGMLNLALYVLHMITRTARRLLVVEW